MNDSAALTLRKTNNFAVITFLLQTYPSDDDESECGSEIMDLNNECEESGSIAEAQETTVSLNSGLTQIYDFYFFFRGFETTVGNTITTKLCTGILNGSLIVYECVVSLIGR